MYVWHVRQSKATNNDSLPLPFRCADNLTVETTAWEKVGTQSHFCTAEAIGNQASQPDK